MSCIAGSILVTTYQAGKVALVGWSGNEVSLLLRDLDKPMGAAVSGDKLAIATRDEILCFANARAVAPHYPVESPKDYDALYLLRTAYRTGDLGVHDVAYGNASVWFVNTLFSCLATTGDDFSFHPRWRPPFIEELSPDDGCHLNGLAMASGGPRFVTALGTTQTKQGWREKRASGGVLIDVETGNTILTGLSMPHSPRWHDGKLWFLNSGAGELCLANIEAGTFAAVCGLPGFLRGLSFAGTFAIVGLCKVRDKHLFSGLPVQMRFPRLLCGVAVIDLRTGTHAATLEFTTGCHEVYDVLFLPNVQRPMIRTPGDEDARRIIVARDVSYVLPGTGEKSPVPLQ